MKPQVGVRNYQTGIAATALGVAMQGAHSTFRVNEWMRNLLFGA